MSRDLAAAAVLAVLWFGGLTYLSDHGWHIRPDTYRSYQIAGVCTVAVLLTRQTWPRGTLLAVALTYPWLYHTWLVTDFHLLPYVLAAYTVAATGSLRTILTLLITEAAVTLALIPPADLLQVLLRQESVAEWNFSRVVTLQALAGAAVFLGRAAYRQNRANDELRHRHLELQRLRRIETDQVVTAERTRIARELHDVVAHHISAVVIRAQAADRVADSQPGETRAAVRWIAANGQETLAAMRHVVRVLRSTETGGSLTPQATLAELPQIAERMSAVGLAVDLRLPAIVPVLPAAVELATVRIIQEALTNVLVHARAGRALVELEVLPENQIRLSVHDDGSAGGPPTVPVRLLVARPPTPASAPDAGKPTAGKPVAGKTSGGKTVAGKPVAGKTSAVSKAPAASRAPLAPKPKPPPVLGGNGLVGMRERAASCGGALTIGTSPLGGWLVTAVLNATLEPALLAGSAPVLTVVPPPAAEAVTGPGVAVPEPKRSTG